jgi:hypothetical protein
LYVYVPGEWPQAEEQALFGRRAEEDELELGEPVTVRVSMDKGKRLNPLLMPDNVASQGTAGTASTLVSIGLGMAFGDPKPMIKNLQETVTGGQTNVPLNANMRLFANQFSWVNMGFLNVSSRSQ